MGGDGNRRTVARVVVVHAGEWFALLAGDDDCQVHRHRRPSAGVRPPDDSDGHLESWLIVTRFVAFGDSVTAGEDGNARRCRAAVTGSCCCSKAQTTSFDAFFDSPTAVQPALDNLRSMSRQARSAGRKLVIVTLPPQNPNAQGYRRIADTLFQTIRSTLE